MNAKPVWKTLLSALFLLFALFCVLFYLWSDLFIAELQSDVPDTLMWARATVESGKLADKDFYYPYVIPFGGNLLLALPYSIWGFSVTTIRVGMTAFIALLTAAAVAFFRAAVFRRNDAALCATGIVLLFFLYNTKLREILYAHIIHYSLAILFFLLLGTFLALWQGGKTPARRAIWLVLLSITAFFCGAEGLPVPGMSLIPLAAACVGERILSAIFKKHRPEDGSRLLPLLPVLISAVLGYGLYLLVTNGVPAYYGERYLSNISLADAGVRLTMLKNEWCDWLLKPALFADVAPILNPLSALGTQLHAITTAFMTVCPCLLLVLTLCRYNTLKTRVERLIVLSFWAQAAEMAILFIATLAGDTGWRIIPLFFCMLASAFVLLRNLLHARPVLTRAFAGACTAVLVALALIAGAGTVAAKPEADIWTREGSMQDVLRKNGATTVYCENYTYAVILDLLSPDMDVRYVRYSGDRVYPALYEARVSDFTDDEGPFYVIQPKRAEDAMPKGGRLLYSGPGYSPSYSRRTDTMIDFELWVYVKNPLQPYYFINHLGRFLTPEGEILREKEILPK